MKIGITGTPGTGKTEVSKELSKLLNYKYIDLNK
ncbi:MAG: AAA family ATPase, partial [Candidatus Aenigmarchaeota archaeon]|nr:AAA family ATPase [Candidatus Aenigmarchaeota archaeon]